MKIEGIKGCFEKTGGLFYFARMCSKIRLHAAGKLPADYFDMLGQGFDGRTCRYLGVKYEDVKAQVLAWREAIRIFGMDEDQMARPLGSEFPPGLRRDEPPVLAQTSARPLPREYDDARAFLELIRQPGSQELCERLQRRLEASIAGQKDAMVVRRRGGVHVHDRLQIIAGDRGGKRVGRVQRVLQPSGREAPDTEAAGMSGGGTDVSVLRLDEVVATGRDSPRRPLFTDHFEVAVEDEEEGILARVLDLLLHGSPALLLARELDEVLEQSQTDPTEGRETSQATGSGRCVHRVRAGEGGWRRAFIAMRCKRGTMESLSWHGRRPSAEW